MLKDDIVKIKSVTTKAIRSKPKRNKWDLHLYIAGKSPKASTAVSNLKQICKNQIKDNYSIEVIDLLKHPKLARENQIVALPTLIRSSPLPVKSIIGDLSNTEGVLIGLDLLNESVIQRM